MSDRVTMPWRSLSLLLVALQFSFNYGWPWPFNSAREPSKKWSTCGMAGDKCSMPRDCCENHECAEGDWAETTDYVCKRVGEKPTVLQYAHRLKEICARGFAWRGRNLPCHLCTCSRLRLSLSLSPQSADFPASMCARRCRERARGSQEARRESRGAGQIRRRDAVGAVRQVGG